MPDSFIPGKDPSIHYIGGRVGSRTGLDTVAKREVIFLCNFALC